MIRPALVNLLDPLRTLYPYVSLREFAWVYVQLMRPEVRHWLQVAGVWSELGAIKIDEGTILEWRKTEHPSWFRWASLVNRAVGYLVGYRRYLQEHYGTNWERLYAERLEPYRRARGRLTRELVALAREMGGDDAHRNGLRWARRVEYDNSAWNCAPLLRSPIGRILFQFKGYVQKAIEDFFFAFSALEQEALGRQGGRRGGGRDGDGTARPAGSEREPFVWWLARIIKYIAGQTLVGGIKSLLGVWGTLLGAYLLYQKLKAELEKAGMKKEDAEVVADAVWWGAPALLGIDLTYSVTVWEAPYGFSPEERLVNLYFGPTLGSALSVYKEADEPVQALKRLTPAGRWVEIFPQLVEGREKIQIGKSKRLGRLTQTEAILYALGFQPLTRSKQFEKRHSQKGSR